MPHNVCPECKKSFQVGGRGWPKKTAKFCSRTCMWNAKRYLVRPSKPVNQMAVAEAAYLAGLLDGEGFIGLYRRTDSKHRRIVQRVAIGMTREEPLRWVIEATGVGTLHYDWDGNPKHARRASWIITGPVAVAVARQVRPYLTLKHKQADLICEFQTAIDTRRDNRKWMEAFFRKSKFLNKSRRR